MKINKTCLFLALMFSLIGGLLLSSAHTIFAISLPEGDIVVTPIGPEFPQNDEQTANNVVNGWYFYGNDCPHCLAVLEEIIKLLQLEWGNLLDIRLLEISIPEYYEVLMLVEAYFDVPPAERSIPTLVIGEKVLIGETPIRENLSEMVAQGVYGEGVPFPEIAGINPSKLISVAPVPAGAAEDGCDTDESCVVSAPIFIAYFYQTGCKECSRVEADLTYLQSRYPQMQIEEFNIYDHADLANWMTERIDPDSVFQSPALFIGDDVLMGEEILPENILPILQKYEITGTNRVWQDFNPEEGQRSIIERFRNMGWIAVVAAGLIDGINPCAFATLIFFVSYLTLSGRKGKEVLLVGGGFTLGVFIAYLGVGLGLYQVLELLGSTLEVFAKIVYIITGILCLVLAVFSFLDFRRAKQGDAGDMLLKLPEPLRKRINATIRQGRKSRSYILGAFGAGVLISFLELACTGQVYLPTIIFVSSIPGLRLQAFFYLFLYNLLFILPLVIIFILVYFGTTSSDLTHFLKKRTALVKLGMGIVFIALGGWLLFSLSL